MIRTTKQVLINPQFNQSEVIYFEITERFEGLTRTNQGEIDVVAFKMRMYTLQGETKTVIGENPVMFRKSTFVSLFGNMTYNDFLSQLDTLMIQQILYVNNKTWTGTEIQKVLYFPNDITSTSDLEIV